MKSSTSLSINVNKIALLRNARDGGQPDVLTFSETCVQLGAQGITVHPRPDGRHIRYQDVHDLAMATRQWGCEFNVEGYPSDDFVQLVLDCKPTQVTLVPDPPEALTSSFGWDVVTHTDLLGDLMDTFRNAGIRSSLFIDPDLGPPATCQALSRINPDRVELYTYDYAKNYQANPEQSVAIYQDCVATLQKVVPHIGINAGHDLNADNLSYFLTHVPYVLEVSIGHAFVCDCLNSGLEHTMNAYLAGLH